jgi:sugar lactone lactonase YvrE
VFRTRFRSLAIVALAALSGSLLAGAPARAGDRFPTTIALPDGWQPEGIAIGVDPVAYFGSRVDGDLYRVDLRTGAGSVFSQGPGTPSLGLKTDGRGRLFVAGGSGGDARVVDARSGRVLVSYQLSTVPAFVNDVVLTLGSAWFTDSRNPVLYRITRGTVTNVPLTGAMVYGDGNNANGVTATPDGRGLLIVQSNTGKLFRATPDGVTTEVDLGGELLTNGDGMLLDGTTLYVVQNRLNQVAKIELDCDGSSGRVLTRVTDPRFDVPTTVAAYGKRLYLPNARFTTPPTPTTPYTAVAIPRP